MRTEIVTTEKGVALVEPSFLSDMAVDAISPARTAW